MRYYPNYFDDFFNDTKKQDTNTVLRTDIYEKDGYYQICMEVCGIQKENIQIELKDGYLKITATRNINKEDTRVLRQERFTGTYSRSFYIGEGYKQEDIKARFDNGELFIFIFSTWIVKNNQQLSKVIIIIHMRTFFFIQ